MSALAETIGMSSKENIEKGKCRCKAYHERTGRHTELCPVEIEKHETWCNFATTSIYVVCDCGARKGF